MAIAILIILLFCVSVFAILQFARNKSLKNILKDESSKKQKAELELRTAESNAKYYKTLAESRK